MWRADRDTHGGEIVAYLRSDLAGNRKTLRIQKYRIYKCRGYYRSVRVADLWAVQTNDIGCLDDMHRTIYQVATNYDIFVSLGNMNYNCLILDKCRKVCRLCFDKCY